MIRLLLVLLIAIRSAYGNETYQNSSHICDQCTCNDNLGFMLNCNNQKLKDVLAEWPPHNSTLTAIFSYNNITTLKILPVTDQPTKLLFDHCGIQFMDPGTFKNVKNVELIDLSYNLLTTEEIDGQDFKGPYNNSEYQPIAVKYLNLAFNKIHSLPNKLFENMPDLEDLNLAGNNLQVLDIHTQQALVSLKKLKILNLSHNKLTELVESALTGLQNLEEIDLSSNHIDAVPDTLAVLKSSLKVLKLNNNLIFSLDDKSFLGLNLREVHLSNLWRLHHVGPNTFAPMPQLRKLIMTNNTILKHIDREAFGPNQTLEEVHLNKNGLNNLDYNLLNWAKLRIFELNDNPLTCSCTLFNITRSLSNEITNKIDGPFCIDVDGHTSKQMYSLTDEICETEHTVYSAYQVSQRFHTVRIIVITLCSVLTLATLVAMTIAILRHRRSTRNYPFAAQISYNRISRQFPM